MASLFSSLFKIVRIQGRSLLEDYTTEIFTKILQNPEILKEFIFRFLGIKLSLTNFKVISQKNLGSLDAHEKGSRPDIFIECIGEQKVYVFIENKIDSCEGYNQLKNYAEHLTNMKHTYPIAETFLIYLTRDYEPKDENDLFENCTENKRAQFKQIRWLEVYEFLKHYKQNPIVCEFITFLKENKIAMENCFTPSDFLAMTHFLQARSKMEECMCGEAKSKCKLLAGTISAESACLSQFRSNQRYIYYSEIQDSYFYAYGFAVSETVNDCFPEVRVMFEMYPGFSLRDQMIPEVQNFVKYNNCWKEYGLNKNEWGGIYISKPVTDFMHEKDQLKAIEKFFVDHLKELEEIRNILNKFSDK